MSSVQTPFAKTVIVGHRGARQEAPENTLAGFQLLRDLGIHHVELDLRLSKDNQLVVIHDKTVDRTTEHSGGISDFTAANLAKMNAAHHFSNWDSHLGIPLLDEVLAKWQELKSIQLEVKPPSKDQFPKLAMELTNLVQLHHLEKQAIVTSSDTRFLAYMQKHCPSIKRGFVATRFSRNPIDTCKQLRCYYLVLDWRRCNKKLVRKAHALNLHISVWTVNTINAAQTVSSYGVNSIITDVPSRLAPLFHTR
ncbi:hypothetical protein A9Q81_04565 [Gammaproteobacteria bacterium 42_54_T18]|nr:hypothetical protein A9Q81_04565 [Gammaproteobacteria bacterium 42_54_T18]